MAQPAANEFLACADHRLTFPPRREPRRPRRRRCPFRARRRRRLLALRHHLRRSLSNYFPGPPGNSTRISPCSRGSTCRRLPAIWS